MKLNDKLKIGTSILAGGLAIYATEKIGLSDLIVNHEIWKASYFGEWAKSAAEYLSPLTRISGDFGMGAVAGLLTYAGLEILDSSKSGKN